MIVARDIEELQEVISGSCVTIGNFDGVHKGHQRLIQLACDKARSRDLTSVVVTFDPHPLTVLRPGHTPPFITLAEQKLELIGAIGPNVALVLPFDRAMAALPPEQFVRRYLVDGVRMKELVIGYDYAMGKGRTGNHEKLVELGAAFGFGVERLDPVIIGDAVVSSTRIRDLIQSGDVWGARPLLGRFFQVRGEVIRGKDRGGRLLGFPTANIGPVDELLPLTGIYAVWVEVEGEKGGEVRPAVANIGFNPTFGNDALSVEVYIMDFNRDIYGQHIRVHFVQRIREERKFDSLDALVERINRDVLVGRRILEQPEAQAHATLPGADNS